MARLCEVCLADLDALGKRADATTCGSTCRAEKSRRLAAGEPLRDAVSAPRPRSKRPGLEVYVPAEDIEVLISLKDSASPVLAALAERTERLAERRAAR